MNAPQEITPMPPLMLFDKSFLQALSVNEAVWLDQFFLTNVCTMFYIETLADLKKEFKDRVPEQEVSGIANKFPSKHGKPSVYHVTMATANLFGHKIPMFGSMMIPAGLMGTIGGKAVSVSSPDPEATAFLRWQDGDFSEVEKIAASQWRGYSFGYKPPEVLAILKTHGFKDEVRCNSVADVKRVVDEFYDSLENRAKLVLALCLLGINQAMHEPIIKRWFEEGEPPLAEYAPYVAYMLKVELVFHVSVQHKQLRCDEGKNDKKDMTYFFYAPFCRMFVSSDKVHRTCSPLFLRPDQEFVWGGDLKNALRELNEGYSKLPESVRKGGIDSFAPLPPRDGQNLVCKLWDKYVPDWRVPKYRDPEAEKKTTEWLRNQGKAVTDIMSAGEKSTEPDEEMPEAVIMPRTVTARRGDWAMVDPSWLTADDEDGEAAEADETTSYPQRDRTMMQIGPDHVAKIRGALTLLSDEAGKFIQSYGADPTPTSKAAAELASFARPVTILSACSLGRLLIDYGADHASTFVKILTEPIEVIAAWTCVRSMLEACSLSAWMLDPLIDAEERAARVFAHRYEGLEQQLKFGRSAGVPAQAIADMRVQIDKVELDAISAGLARVVDRSGNRIGIGRKMLGATELINEVLDEEKAYRLLSSVAHGHHWAITQLAYKVVAEDASNGPLSIQSLGKDVKPEAMAYLGKSVLMAMTRPLWNQCRYFGWDELKLEELFETVADRMQISTAIRFWRSPTATR